jgi:MFS family permease
MQNLLSPTRLRLILFTLYLIVFLNSFGYFLIIPVLSNLILDPHHSLISSHLTQTLGDYLFSVVLGAGSLASLCCGPILGRWSDYIGRRKVLIFCTLLTIISFILPILSMLTANLTLFILGNVINGISSNNQPIAQAAISDLTQKRQKKAMRFSIDTCVITAAMTLGPIAGSYLSDPSIISFFGPTTPFIAAGLLTLISLFLLLCIFPETNLHTVGQAEASRNRLNWQAFTDVIKLNPSIQRLLLAFFLAQTAWAQFYQYIYLYLPVNLQFSERQLSVFTAMTGFWISIGLIIIYPLYIRLFSLRTGTSLCFLVCCLSLGWIGFFPSANMIWWLLIPLAIGIGMYFPSLLTLFSDYAQVQQQGWIMAICSALLGLSWLLTGFTAIALSHIQAQLPLITAALLLFIAFVIMMYDNRQKQLK